MLLSQKLTPTADIQVEEFRVSINLPYVEGTSKKLRHILRSHKIRLTLYKEIALRKLFCKPKYRGATKDKNNIDYEIDCSNCQAVYFGESKWSLKLRTDLSVNAIVIRMKVLNTAGKQITTLSGIRRKLMIGKAG